MTGKMANGRRKLPASFLEKVSLEAFFDHLLDAGVGSAEAVEHGCIGLVGVAFPKNVTVLVDDGRGEPGAGAVEYHLLPGFYIQNEIGLGGLIYAYPLAGGGEFPGNVFYFIGGNRVLQVVGDLDIHLVSGSDRLVERSLGQG